MENMHKSSKGTGNNHTMDMGNNQYKNLLVMTVISFITMYFLMYSMVDHASNIVHNINQVYMAGLMTMPMVIIELIVMRGMYLNKQRNLILLGIGLLLGVLCFLGIRKQAFVEDGQFLKSMIPHHAAAILMVKEAKLNDPEVKKLGEDIIVAQQKEIDWMKAKIRSLEKK